MIIGVQRKSVLSRFTIALLASVNMVNIGLHGKRMPIDETSDLLCYVKL